MTVPSAPDSASAARLYEIAAGLAAIGLATRLHRTRTVTDLTATLRPPGHREIEVILDEDGYTELRHWADLSTTPTAIVATIIGALAAITPPGSLTVRAGQAAGQLAGYDGAVTERAEG